MITLAAEQTTEGVGLTPPCHGACCAVVCTAAANGAKAIAEAMAGRSSIAYYIAMLPYVIGWINRRRGRNMSVPAPLGKRAEGVLVRKNRSSGGRRTNAS